MSFINKSTANKLITDPSTDAIFCPVKEMTEYIEHIDYNHKVIDILGEVSVTIKSAGWCTKAKFLVVEKARCLMGLDYQSKIGIRTSDSQP